MTKPVRRYAVKKTKIEPVHQMLGLRVQEYRCRMGLTQQQLADQIGLQRESIANMETGRQRFLLQVVERLADALGTSPLQLLKGIWT